MSFILTGENLSCFFVVFFFALISHKQIFASLVSLEATPSCFGRVILNAKAPSLPQRWRLFKKEKKEQKEKKS
jgi:hypothetical protein